ncbi:hypothetical protein AQUCO_07100013v1 [Aquilegia coerulea]|uniref:Uncharacterized protein n=1 Tax=Aquilegia coerulea TaxID=218851 RepID=A0A2G5CAP7_AQUCA|nr:hypothetical protein AQUCO_07100013v1 [Aquilegia coerulea]PIA28347.1 hypothetical protein AQUCO_07100013v1 [Aquilegia coerulea]
MALYVGLYSVVFPKGIPLCREWDFYVLVLGICAFEAVILLGYTVKEVGKIRNRQVELRGQDQSLHNSAATFGDMCIEMDSENIVESVRAGRPADFQRMDIFNSIIWKPLKLISCSWWYLLLIVLPFLGFLVMGIVGYLVGMPDSSGGR